MCMKLILNKRQIEMKGITISMYYTINQLGGGGRNWGV